MAVAINAVARETVVLEATGPSILTFPTEQSGKVYPLRSFSEPALIGATGIAVDPAHQELAVSRSGEPAILFYSLQADNHGRLPENSKSLLRKINGDKTTLSTPSSLVILKDEVFVTDQSANQILVFERKASGDASPLRTIRGELTGLDSPVSVQFLAHSRILEVINQNGSIVRFKLTDSGNVAPASRAQR